MNERRAVRRALGLAITIVALGATPGHADTVADHRWVAEVHCKTFDEGFRAECRRNTMDCVFDPPEEDNGFCPTFSNCRYLVDDRVVSESRCGVIARPSARGSFTGFFWQNGNVMHVFSSVEEGLSDRWNGRDAERRRIGGADCVHFPDTGESFCSD